MSQNVGSIQQVIGPVVDISFPAGMALPKILEALEVDREGQPPLVMECQKHIGEDTVRAIAMDATEGLQRGMAVRVMGRAMSMPTGEAIKGRLFNVTGQAIDGIAGGKVDTAGPREIHQASVVSSNSAPAAMSQPETLPQPAAAPSMPPTAARTLLPIARSLTSIPLL